MTIRERIWRFIKAADHPVGPSEIGAALDMDPERVSHHLRHMRKWCDMVMEGRARLTVYSIPKGATYKCPGRGSSPNSRSNLQPWDWRKGYEAMRRVRGMTPHVPKPTFTDLELCWPSMIRGR